MSTTFSDLNRFRCDKDDATHRGIGGKTIGNFKIPSNELINLYNYIVNNPKNCVTEIPGKNFRLFFDIDNLDEDLDIKQVIKLRVLPAIKRVIKVRKPTLSDYHILYNKSKSKTHFHIHFPKIIVSKDTAEKIAEVINSADSDRKLVDKSVYASGLRMYPTLKPSKKNNKKSEQDTNYEFLIKDDKKTIEDIINIVSIFPFESEKANKILLTDDDIDDIEEKEEKSDDSEIKIDEKELSRLCNKVFGTKSIWSYEKNPKNDGYILKNNSNYCLVQKDHDHGQPHSCFYLNKGTSTINCYSHGNLKVDSKKLRALKQYFHLIKSDEEENDFERLRNKLCEYAEKRGYKRSGGFVMKPNDKIPVLYERYKQFKDFINEVFTYNIEKTDAYYKLYRKAVKNHKQLLNYLEDYEDVMFGTIQIDKHIFAFKDGYLDISDLYHLKFISYEDAKKSGKTMPTTTRYYNYEFDMDWLKRLDLLDTPIFDKICNYHFRDDEPQNYQQIYEIFLGMIGRLHYQIGDYDNFNCMFYIKGGSNTGKCHGYNTPIMMSDGTIKMVQDIKEGELLMGDDSKPRKVLSLARGEDDMFEIINKRGDRYVVNSEHILCLKRSSQPFLYDRKNQEAYKVSYFDGLKLKSKQFSYKGKDKKEIKQKAQELLNKVLQEYNPYITIPVKKYIKLSAKQQKDLKGYQVDKIDFESKNIDLDPYILGFWLGDGESKGTRITNQDAVVLKYLSEKVKDYNCYLQYGDKYTYRITSLNTKSSNQYQQNNKFLNILRSLNLLDNKHIPFDYKSNSRDNRLKLLAGLIDSDGYYDKKNGYYEISQKNPKLSKDIVYLCRSLGFACNLKKCKKSCIYKEEKREGEYNRITIYGNGLNEIPVLCERKKGDKRKRNTNPLVSEIKVKYLGKNNYYGFQLDGNHKYVLDNFIVTHNTTCAEIILSNHQNIGTISSKMEDKFGLESFVENDNDLIFCGDLPKKFHIILDKADFQRMIEGGGLSIARKGKTAINNYRWRAPMIFLGNYFPEYKDSSGAVPRRMCVFYMNKFIPNTERKGDLKDKCIKEESHLLLLKSLYYYKELIQKFNNKTFEDWNIPYFRKGYEELMVNCNPLWNFLNLAPNDFEFWPYFKEGMELPLNGKNGFKKKFERYLYLEVDRKLKYKEDTTTLGRKGYKLISKNLCGACGKIVLEEDQEICCSDYESNIKKKYFIQNMVIRDASNCDINDDSDSDEE